MRIGIFAYRQTPFVSANTAIAYAVGEQLSKTEEVIYIGRRQDSCQSEISTLNGSKITFLNKTPRDKNPRIANYLIRFNLMKLAFWKDVCSLERIIKNERIDVLICITAPNDNAFITMSAQLNIPVYIYQLDPFYNLGDIENKRLKRLFAKYLKKARHLFTTQLLMNDYCDDPELKAYLDKISVVQFPKLIEPHFQKVGVKEGTKLLYAGSLYAERKPMYLIDLKDCLPSDCSIIFCGNCENDSDYNLLQDNGVNCKGYCSHDVLKEEIEKADVLINIGNTVKNQMPSKIVDYIATGKPILNLSQIEDCSSMSVLKDYELCLNIEIKSIVQNKENIIDFIQKTKGQRIPWEIIQKKYWHFTPEFVAESILECIKKEH